MPTAATLQAAESARILAERRKAYPIAYEKLWHNEPPKTSQRAALRQFVAGTVLLLAVLGGNRSGKSRLLAQWLVANGLGRDYAYRDGRRMVYPVQLWLDRNELPEALIPNGPGCCWVGSPAFGAATQQIRPHIRRFCPTGTRFVRWDQPAEAELWFPNGGQIISKAYKQFDQDKQTWEGGSNVRAIGLDEEPNSYENLLAALSRLIDEDGKCMVALTHLRGPEDWFNRQIVESKEADYRTVHLDGAHNPFIPQEARERILRRYPPWQRAARERGEIVSPEGAIYPFTRHDHVIEDVFTIPVDWTRFSGTDWGGRSPHIVWATLVRTPMVTRCGKQLLPGDLVCYRELAPRKERTEPAVSSRRLIEEAIALEKGSPEGMRLASIYRVADSEDPGAIEEAAEQGWYCEAASKGPGSVTRGMGLVEARLQTTDPLTSETLRPRLYVMRTCPVLITEMQGLRWAEAKDGQEPKPDDRCPDHGPDCVRYIETYIDEQGFTV